jgi:hypothetical protein
MYWIEDMFKFKLTSLILHVLNCTTVTPIEVCLGKQSGCFTLEKSSTLRMVPQVSRGSGCMILEVMPVSVAPHPSVSYKYCQPP